VKELGMAKFFWVKIRFADGRTATYCVIGKVGKQCFRSTFLPRPPDEPNDALDELTRGVNSLIEAFIGNHPGESLRIVETDEGDQGGQLSFEFVETDLEISLPDPG
jgi:hypothetical protein